MYLIIWEYLVKAERVAEFEEFYSTNGAWTRLFQKSKGFLAMELVQDEMHLHRYITIDRWTSSQDYESFRSQWKTEYAALDSRCEVFTEQETLLGKWKSILPETL